MKNFPSCLFYSTWGRNILLFYERIFLDSQDIAARIESRRKDKEGQDSMEKGREYNKTREGYIMPSIVLYVFHNRGRMFHSGKRRQGRQFGEFSVKKRIPQFPRM